MRKMILLAGVLSFCGCGLIFQREAVIKLADVISAASGVSKELAKAQKASQEATTEVSETFTDLGAFLKAKKMNDERVVAMEKRLAAMRRKTDRFSDSLKDAEGNAKTLFSLLEKRARGISNEQWRDNLLDEVTQKKSEFQLRLDRARNGVEKLNGSIKKYDDIVGYLQVKRGIAGVAQYMGDVEETVLKSAELNKEIQSAIADGLRIVDPKQFRD
jgi:hypothetical protein